MAYPYVEDLIGALTGWHPGTRWLPVFGVFVVIALLTSLSLARRRLARLSEPPIDVATFESVSFIAILASLVGAKLFHAIEYMDSGFFAQVFSRQGYSIYGGWVFGLLTTVWLLRRRGRAVLPTLDFIAPYLLLGYAIGRIGCQLSGDGDWGQRVDLALKPDWLPTWLWAQTYENNIAGVVIPPPGVYPTPIYESLLALLGCAVVLGVRRGWAHRTGATFATFLLVAGASRFFIEFVRINPRYTGLDLTQAQLLSAVAVLGGLLLIGWRWRSGATYEARS